MVPCHFAYSEWKLDKQPATPVKSKMEPLSSGTDRNSGRSLTNSFSFSCSKVLCHIIRYSRHHGIIDQYRYLICLGCCPCYSHLKWNNKKNIQENIQNRRKYQNLNNAAVPCIFLSPDTENSAAILDLLNQVEHSFDQKAYCYELKIKGLLCEAFSMILREHQSEFHTFLPSNQVELERLEHMLHFLHTHFDSVFTLQALADDVHLSREVCCRLFKKMTGKTISSYLEEYRVAQSLSLVQSGQYSMMQIADITGFSNASRFASAFCRQFGCNPGEYHSRKQKLL